MPNRREFLTQAIAAGGAPLWGPELVDVKDRSDLTTAQKPLRVLILGGTGFIGPHYVRAALARGHKVAVFNRGKSKAELPSGVERLVGDRNGDLAAIKNRDWDAVIDLPTYVPAWVRSLGEALHGRVGHYTFISTINVYDHSGDNGNATDENSKLVEYKGETDPYSLTEAGQYYGELKVLCEREAERQFPGKTLILRPSYIVGPGDPLGALAYWAARMEKGGEILAAGDPLSRIHVIDVRDMTQWTIDMAERSATGRFSAVGPAAPMTWGLLLKSLRGLSPVPVKFTWVPVSWLAEHKITSTFSNLLFWTSRVSTAGANLILNDKARAQGLVLRPLSETVADVLALYKERPAGQAQRLLLDGMKSLEESMTRERSLLAAWHEDADTS
ncbi:MAG: NAD-dependent epimerase/dehydratase family protein [Acidobacteria bacterium]|nr:NAD-dependent epimerase/dehydratase family protein [Acidobacteriota bacterium]